MGRSGAWRVWLLGLVPAAGLVHLAWAAPPVILAAAAVPAAAYALLLIAVDRYEREPGPALFAALLWGAGVAAPLAAVLNDALLARVAGIWTPVLGGPVVEEACKGAVLAVLLLVLRDEFDDVLDGMVYGALVGIGFALAENVGYLTLAAVQGGTAGLVRGMYLRAFLGGLNHALFTATTGAGLGWWRAAHTPAGRWLAPGLGFLGACGQHVAWNAVASRALTDIVCNPVVPGAACREAPSGFGLLVGAPLVVVATVGPGALVLALVAVLALRREARVVATALRDEARSGLLGAAEYACLCSARVRVAAEWRAFVAGGLRAWRARRRFHQAATELAFRRWRVARGERPTRRQRGTTEEEYRARLLRFRQGGPGPG
jgi:RsiW-degrading membrane proteinase PrsW (M82 family)